MKKITKSLFLSLISLAMVGCGSEQITTTSDANKTNEKQSDNSDIDILKKSQHTPSDTIDVQLDPTTHKCTKIEVSCGTHQDCWPYRCVDTSQFVDDIVITQEASAYSNGYGVNHVTFNSLEIGRTYKKDVNFTIPKIQKFSLKGINKEDIREVSIENDVISTYLECDDLESQYRYLSQTDKAEWSHPAKDYQEYTISWNAAPGIEYYKIDISENAEFTQIVAHDDVNGTSYDYGFYVPGKTYYVKVIGNDYEHPVFEDCFKIKDNELRYVNVDGAQNMRDLGGWKTYDGKTVNYELLYRGANFNGSSLHTDLGTDIANGCGSGKLTNLGKEQMEQLGFKTEIDLRTPLSKEAYDKMKSLGTGRPSGEGDDGGQWMFGAGWNNDLDCLVQADMNGLMYEHLVSDSFMAYYKTIIQNVFDRLARKENYPVYFHCNAGADRTGTYGFMLNGLLGVQYNDLTKDYQLTSYSNGGGRRWRNKGNGERFYKITEIDESIGALKPGWQFDSYNTWDLLVRRMLKRYGYENYIEKLGTEEEGNIIQVCIEKWLLEEGVTQEQINAYKDIMLNSDSYEEIKDKEFVVKLNNVPNKTSVKVHGGETLPELNIVREGYVLTGFKDKDGKNYNRYHRISEDMELTAIYKAYCDDLGQDTMVIYDWTTKKAKELIKNNPDYKYEGCSAAYAEGVAQFMPRNEACLDTKVDMPLINYSEYGYVSFFVTSAWTTAKIYIDDYYLGEVQGTNLTKATKFNISISGSIVYVNGNYAYRLTSAQNKGLSSIKLRYVMETYSKSADLCVSPLSTKVVDHVALAKSYAETLENIVYGGFNNAKTLNKLAAAFNKYYAYCNEYEASLVNPSQNVLDLVNNIRESVNIVSYRVWGEISSTEELLAEDVLKEPAFEPLHKPYEFAYWGTEEGKFTGFNDTIDSDLVLDAYYSYKSAVTGETKYAKQVFTMSYYCFPDFNGNFGSNENTVAPGNPSLPDGYTFVRWTSNMDTMEEFEFGSTLNDDVTLYAVVKDSSEKEVIFKNIYHVTFVNGNGDGKDKVVEVFEEDKVNKIDGPAYEDYEFAYWGYNNVEFDFSTPIVSDLTLKPFYWSEADSITKNYYTVYDIDKKMNDFALANPEAETGWVANSGNGQYMAIVSSGFIEFGLRKPNKADYTLNIPKFNFNEYKCVSFDVKNTWTVASYAVDGVSVGSIGINAAFKVVIKNGNLYAIIAGEEVYLKKLDNDILTGQESLTIDIHDSTNGNGGGSFDIYNFYAYRIPFTL